MHDPLRPTFERDVPELTPAALSSRIRAALEAEGGPPHRRAGDHFLIWVPDERRHMWSPWLHLDATEAENAPGTAHVRGRFTPAPSLWTAIMMTYLALGTTALGGGLFGYAQWSLGESPWGLWLVAGALVAALLILLASRAGQALARQQMGELSSVVERALGDPPAAAPAS